MPPSGCYFSRDNKNYRLSGLENNRSSGLPPDRGLHSLSLDTQAVAVDLLLLSFSFFFPRILRSSPRCPHHLSLSLSLSDFLLVPLTPFLSLIPLVVVALTGPGTPYDASPLLLSPSPLATSSWPVAWLASLDSPPDSLNLQFQVASNATTTTGRPLPLYILHIINYQSLSLFLSSSLPPPFLCPWDLFSSTVRLTPHERLHRSVG